MNPILDEIEKHCFAALGSISALKLGSEEEAQELSLRLNEDLSNLTRLLVSLHQQNQK